MVTHRGWRVFRRSTASLDWRKCVTRFVSDNWVSCSYPMCLVLKFRILPSEFCDAGSTQKNYNDRSNWCWKCCFPLDTWVPDRRRDGYKKLSHLGRGQGWPLKTSPFRTCVTTSNLAVYFASNGVCLNRIKTPNVGSCGTPVPVPLNVHYLA